MRWNHPDTWVWSDTVVHEPLVSVEDFEAAQGVAAQHGRSRKTRERQRVQRTYVLRGTLLCGLCDRRMQGQYRHDAAYYRCRYPNEYAPVTHTEHPRRRPRRPVPRGSPHPAHRSGRAAAGRGRPGAARARRRRLPRVRCRAPDHPTARSTVAGPACTATVSVPGRQPGSRAARLAARRDERLLTALVLRSPVAGCGLITKAEARTVEASAAESRASMPDSTRYARPRK
jgi:hypothetical protein